MQVMFWALRLRHANDCYSSSPCQGLLTLLRPRTVLLKDFMCMHVHACAAPSLSAVMLDICTSPAGYGFLRSVPRFKP